MILYDPQIPVSLIEFGIQIPIRDSRATKTLQALVADPDLGPVTSRWHQGRIVETLDKQDLLRVHAETYVRRLYSDELEKEILNTYELVDPDGNYNRYAPDLATKPLTGLFERTLGKAAGTVQAGRTALTHGFCFYFSGGMHHAHRNHGSGFCLVNDIVIAARKLQYEQKAQKIWVVDVDAHKGDGTAALTAADNSIHTLSIHMARGWPLDGPAKLEDGTPNPCFIPSDIDIPIESGEEEKYVDRLTAGLHQLERLGTADLTIVVCGADPFEKDELPSTAGLRLSLDQMLARDQLIYHFLTERGIPAAFLMAGGYGDHVWQVYARFLTWALKLRIRP